MAKRPEGALTKTQLQHLFKKGSVRLWWSFWAGNNHKDGKYYFCNSKYDSYSNLNERYFFTNYWLAWAFHQQLKSGLREDWVNHE